MKNIKKIGIILVIVGSIVLGVAALQVGGNWERLSSVTPFEEKYFTTSAEITRIEVDVDNVEVIVEPSDDDGVHVVYFENNRMTYEIKEGSNQKLTIKNKFSNNISDWVGINISEGENYLKILVPSDSKVEIDIEGSNGSISVEDIQLSKALIKTSNAKISLQDVDVLDRFEVKTSNGKIELINVSGNNIIVKTSNGRIEADNVTMADKLELTTSNSAIDVYEISAGNLIELKTSNANISGRITGKKEDFRINSSTSNGSNNLGNSDGGSKSLRVETSNGSIDISFYE